MTHTGESSTNRWKTSLWIMTVASPWIPQLHAGRQLIKLFNDLHRAGYSTVAYAIDIDRLRSAFGSGDEELLREVETKQARSLRRGDETFEDMIRDGAPTRREALRQILAGEIQGPDWAGFQYGYALELLCKHL